MEKQLTLNQTWILCLRMWRWIAKQRKEGNERSVPQLKSQWVQDNKYTGKNKIQDKCFFCEYANQQGLSTGCQDCPGSLVDEYFECSNEEYNWYENPEQFYKKLLELNKKRKG